MKCPRTHSRPARGFSLLELLIVMGLIVILFVFMYGGTGAGFQAKQLAECEKNLQSIYVALKTYSIDNNGQLPSLAGAQTSEPVLSLLVPRATTGTHFFLCPGTEDKELPDAQPFAARRISYAYYMGQSLSAGTNQPLVTDRQVNTGPKTNGQLLFSPDGKGPGNNHAQYGGNIMFCDGSVQKSPSYLTFDLTNPPGVILLNPKP